MGWLRNVFIGLGITVLGLVLLTLVVGTGAYVAATPYVEREYPTQVMGESLVCNPACAQPAESKPFAVPQGSNRVEASFTATLQAGSGPVRVAVYDERGREVYAHVFAAPTGGVETETVSWAATPGSWTYVQSVAGFHGVLTAQIWSRGLPPGTL